MLHVISNLFAKPATKAVIGVGVFAVACHTLRRVGGDKKVIAAVAKIGDTATGAAVVLTSAAIDAGCLVADGAITTAEVAASAAGTAIEGVGYGLGRSARFVLDTTSAAGNAAASNPLAQGVVSGFYAPENAQAQAAPPKIVEGVAAPATT